jgi:hypothetical protein
MKKLGSEGNDCCWSDEQKHPAAVGSMVDCIPASVEHRKPASAAAPVPETVAKNEALQKHRAFFEKVLSTLRFPSTSMMKTNQTGTQVPTAIPWKGKPF